MGKEIKVEWCENFIKARLIKHHAFPGPGGIEVNYFWQMAEASGLWERGTYGSPMSIALGNLTKIETVYDKDGAFLFNVFKLAGEAYQHHLPHGEAGRGQRELHHPPNDG